MGKIHVLTFEVANLIAAGEVVDRPSSVVKELMENALDAGATEVTVEIKNGGVSFIRVTDNGGGMSFDDLPVAIRRHATSKISEAEDLAAIMTFGFRGEALAAISAVSDVRLYSKTKNDPMGSMIAASGGEITEHEQTGCADGTTVIVENLFGRVPARRKFLKKDATETAACTAVVEKIALSSPDVSVRLITDGNLKFQTAGDGQLKSVIYAVMGRDVASRMIPVSRSEGGLSVSGFIGTPEIARPKRNYENFFINGRYVRSMTMQAAIEQAFVSYIPGEKFPACVLDLTIPPEAVDVNVHPAKMEVKFSNERPVYELVYYAVRSALEGMRVRPEMEIGAPETKKPASPTLRFTPIPTPDEVKPAQETLRALYQTESGEKIRALRDPDPDRYPYRPIPERYDHVVTLRAPSDDFYQKHAPLATIVKKESPVAQVDPKPTPTPTAVETPPAPVEEVPEFLIVGELYGCYVIIELKDKILIIDKHAAHERILFEKLKQNMKNAARTGQTLMIPVEVPMDAESMNVLEEFSAEIESVGYRFEIQREAKKTLIREIPSGMPTSGAADLFETILARAAHGEGDAKSAHDAFFEAALYQTACKAAVKAGRIYDKAHIQWICRELLRLPNIKYCPHGRPVAYEMTKNALDRQFDRA